MALLLLVSVIWGFSFGLIKAEFSMLSAATLAAVRLLIALPCFLPFLTAEFRVPNQRNLTLILIGAVQYGLMYLCLFSAFSYLSAYEVALLTVFTPIYIILADAVLERRNPPLWFWGVALLAVGGALVVFNPSQLPDKLPGILIMQISNLSFAIGQIAYRKVRSRMTGVRDRDCFALLYAGALLLTAAIALAGNPLQELRSLQPSQWGALLYLGTIASGLGFFLWNCGAVQVSAPVLAVFNNLKIPMATLIAVLIFGESAHFATLIPGMGVLLLALAWAEWSRLRKPAITS